MEPAMRQASKHRLGLAAMPSRCTAAAKVRLVCDRVGAQMAAARALAHTGQMPPREGSHLLARL
jgi:hypothetical protein